MSKPPSPTWMAPRGYSRTEAATYIGVGATLFDQMVSDGRMPKPISINTRLIWDVRKLDQAFDILADLSNPTINEWDEDT